MAGAVVHLLAASQVQLSISVGNAGCIMCCGTIGSCQSAATSVTVTLHCHESDSLLWRYDQCPDIL